MNEQPQDQAAQSIAHAQHVQQTTNHDSTEGNDSFIGLASDGYIREWMKRTGRTPRYMKKPVQRHEVSATDGRERA